MVNPSLTKEQLVEGTYVRQGFPYVAGSGVVRPKAINFADSTAHMILNFQDLNDRRPPLIELPGLTLLTWSRHRDQYPVTGLGKSRIKGMTPGHRTVAGSIGFDVLSQTPFTEALERYVQAIGYKGGTATIDPDQLPPFDLSLTFLTPNGDFSRLLIRGIVIVDDSSTLAVRDSNLTNVFSFLAVSVTNVVAGPKFMDLNTLISSTTPPVTKTKGWSGIKAAPTTPSGGGGGGSGSTTTATTGTTTTPATTTSTTTTVPPPHSFSTTTTNTTTSSTTRPPTTTLTLSTTTPTTSSTTLDTLTTPSPDPEEL